MEDRPDTIQIHANPGASPFTDLGVAGNEQRLDISPRDRGANRIGENGLEGRLVPSGQRNDSINFQYHVNATDEADHSAHS